MKALFVVLLVLVIIALGQHIIINERLSATSELAIQLQENQHNLIGVVAELEKRPLLEIEASSYSMAETAEVKPWQWELMQARSQCDPNDPGDRNLLLWYDQIERNTQ